MSSFAQFECGKKYIGASLSGFDLSYNGSEKGNLGLSAKVGYLFADDLMATASIAYDKQNDVPAAYSFGVGARYYIIQNGLFLGASVDFPAEGVEEGFAPVERGKVKFRTGGKHRTQDYQQQYEDTQAQDQNEGFFLSKA